MKGWRWVDVWVYWTDMTMAGKRAEPTVAHWAGWRAGRRVLGWVRLRADQWALMTVGRRAG